MADSTPIVALIVDAGPLISSTSTDSLLSRAEKVYTTPAVIAEIRDAATRARLETTWLPFIRQRTPRAESVKVVSDFARKTGDYAVLSVTDLQLLALTYELEVEGNGGDWRLRRAPGQKGVNGPIPKQKKAGEKGGNVEKAEVKEEVKEEEAKEAAPAPVPEAPEDKAPESTPEPAPETIISSLEATHISPSDGSPSDDSDDSDDSDSGWITAENIHLHKARDSSTPSSSHSSPKPLWPMAAALATTDFAMQNVLLQMNLHLVSPANLHRIRMVKTWVLRCHACFKVCRDMSKQFCPSCGGATLLRTSCSTDSAGKFTLHLKRNMQWSNRGNVYPIPKTQHGSASGKGVRKNLILREDQVEYQREVRQKERQKERDLLDPDYLPGILTGERRDTLGMRPTIGYGRQNPNHSKGGKSKR